MLVQLLRGPYALALDAVSYVWSAFFMSRVDAPDPPQEEHDTGGVLAGARWIRGNAIIRAELLGVATLNLFNFMFFALFLLYATRSLHVRPATLGVVLGVASVGTLLGSVVTARISRRIGVGPAFLIGCFLFPAPLVLVPAAGGPHWLVVAMLFAAEFLSGFGLMLLDILAGAMSAAVDPATLRSRVCRRVHGREQRRPPARDGDRRRARLDDRLAPDALDRDGRRTRRHVLPHPVADPFAARGPRGSAGMSDDPLELFHEWVQGDEMVIATATRRRSAVGARAAPEERRRARLHLLHGLHVAQGTRAGREPARRAALPARGDPGSCRGTRRANPAGGVGRVLALAARRIAAKRRRLAPVGADRLPRRARGRRRGAARRARSGPDRWGGYRLVPDAYEFWRHRDDRLHERHLFRACADGWEQLLLQP